MIDQNSTEAISELLVGRKIVRATRSSDIGKDGVLTLDDGTELVVTPHEGCGGCQAGWYEVTLTGVTDNVITAVRLNADPDVTCFDIFVVTDAAEQLLVCRVEGYDNGWYGHGYTINVRRP